MIKFAKRIFRPVRDCIKLRVLKKKVATRIKSHGYFTLDSFKFEDFKRKIVSFIQLNKMEEIHYLYRYSPSCKKPTLYASAYALMTLSLLGELDRFSAKEKEAWRKYFDSFQSESDGLFYDPVVQNNIYNDADWWGSRHLALHMISAYTDLGYQPRYSFTFLEKYYDHNFIQKWLDQFDWQSASIGNGDIDNKIMNIGCLLQYQRDYRGDTKAGQAIEFLKMYLRSKINRHTGMWGGFDINNPYQISRMIQFAYHLFQIYFYDNDYDFDCERIVKLTLRTKNRLNGFGVNLNSSACEDIDSINILVKLHNNTSIEIQNEIRKTIEEAFFWVLANQVEDGGFVFRLEEPFFYGNIETSSKKNEGAMMPTWFRTLSIAYMADYLNVEGNFKITNCPGYEFK